MAELSVPRFPVLSACFTAREVCGPSLALVCYANSNLETNDSQLLRYMVRVAEERADLTVALPAVACDAKAIPAFDRQQGRSSPVVYESQALEGMTLLAAIPAADLPSNNLSFQKFNNMFFYVVVLNLNSLHQQTLKRVESLQTVRTSETVMKAANTAVADNTLDSVCKDIHTHGQCLYVVIQDESHWGLTPAGFVNIRIHKQSDGLGHAITTTSSMCACLATPGNHFVIEALQGYKHRQVGHQQGPSNMRTPWEKNLLQPCQSILWRGQRDPRSWTKSEEHTTNCEALLSFVAEVYDAQINRKTARCQSRRSSCPHLWR